MGRVLEPSSRSERLQSHQEREGIHTYRAPTAKNSFSARTRVQPVDETSLTGFMQTPREGEGDDTPPPVIDDPRSTVDDTLITVLFDNLVTQVNMLSLPNPNLRSTVFWVSHCSASLVHSHPRVCGTDGHGFLSSSKQPAACILGQKYWY